MIRRNIFVLNFHEFSQTVCRVCTQSILSSSDAARKMYLIPFLVRRRNVYPAVCLLLPIKTTLIINSQILLAAIHAVCIAPLGRITQRVKKFPFCLPPITYQNSIDNQQPNSLGYYPCILHGTTRENYSEDQEVSLLFASCMLPIKITPIINSQILLVANSAFCIIPLGRITQRIQKFLFCLPPITRQNSTIIDSQILRATIHAFCIATLGRIAQRIKKFFLGDKA